MYKRQARGRRPRDGAGETGCGSRALGGGGCLLYTSKLKSDGIRIVYKLEQAEHAMRIVVIGVRSDDVVYREAQKRRESRGL